jgi:hypothetical protein
LLRTVHFEKPEYVPLSWKAIRYVGGMIVNATDVRTFESGEDIFGCSWLVTNIGPIDKPGQVIFGDVTEWKKAVPHMPDLSKIDFKALAEEELSMVPPIDRKENAVAMIDGGGCFTRLVSFMGHENALVALALEPEACMDFFDAFTEYKIEYLNKCIDVFGLDIYIAGDDVATMQNLFMSPETYRKVIKPFHKRVGDAINKRGVIYEVHCCGRTEALIDEYVDNGAKMWQSAEKGNDLAGILDKKKIAVGGGWDFSGPPSYITPDSDDEILREEVRRCLREYKKPGYYLWPTILSDRGNIRKYGDPKMQVVIDEWEKHKWF